MFRFTFGPEKSEKMAQQIVDKASSQVADKVAGSVKPNAVEAAEIAANATKEAARINAEAAAKTAKATRNAAWIRAGASVATGFSAAYAAYVYIKPIEDESKKTLAENKEKSKKIKQLTDIALAVAADRGEAQEMLEQAEKHIPEDKRKLFMDKKAAIKAKFDKEREQEKLPKEDNGKPHP